MATFDESFVLSIVSPQLKKKSVLNTSGSLTLRQGGGSGDDSVTAVATGEDGSIVLALDVQTSSATSSGSSSNSSTTGGESATFQFEVMKLSGDGRQLWQWKVRTIVYDHCVFFRTHRGRCCARVSNPGEEGGTQMETHGAMTG